MNYAAETGKGGMVVVIILLLIASFVGDKYGLWAGVATVFLLPLVLMGIIAIPVTIHFRYERQRRDAGMKMVKEMLAALAMELRQPDIEAFEFKEVDRDLTYDRVSLFDRKKNRVVTKMEKHDLEMWAREPSLQTKLRSQVDAAVRSYVIKLNGQAS